MTGVDDPDGVGLGRLLTDLVDDPDAPPSPVSALSVIAAAKASAGQGASPAADRLPAVPPSRAPAVPRSGGPAAAPAVGAAAGTVGELHVLSVHQDADRRAKRRRTMIFGGLAAACAVAIAAVVIPIAVSNSSSTTSAGAAADQSAARAESGGPEATASAAASAAASAGPEAPADQDAGGAAAAPGIDPSNPDANRPPPGESALNELVPVPGGTAPTDGGTAPVDGAGGGGPAASCWPALSDTAASALVGSLPAGSFGAPGLLGLGCPAEPVGGAQLAGTAPDTQLVVRVTRAEPGACAQSASETGARCVARGGDQYVANDSGNLSVYAYGNGYEVEVGGRPATGIAPIPSGLSAEQLSAAAAAVLGALG